MGDNRNGTTTASALTCKPIEMYVTEPIEGGTTIVIASWNVNSIKARLEHMTAWLKLRNPDVLLLQ